MNDQFETIHDTQELIDNEEQISHVSSLYALWQYWKANNSTFLFILLVTMFIFAQFSCSMADFWLALW